MPLIARFRALVREDWRPFLCFAWSLRVMLLAGLLNGLSAAFQMLFGYLPLGPFAFASINCLLVAVAFVASMLTQRKLTEARK